jgi:hypothetical protein
MAVLSQHGDQTAMNATTSFAPRYALLTLAATLLLSACASQPVPPDWQSNASSSLQWFTSAYLTGQQRMADLELARSRTELASTGRADLVAKAELTRCAVRVASLELDDCAGYQPLAQDAGAEAQAYAAYLTGSWQGLNAALLPEQHRAVLTRTPGTALPEIKDPLARLVAAGVLLKVKRLTPADVSLAVETASQQGWRRPLLAWLGVQRQLAAQAGQTDAADLAQRRMDLVGTQPPR